MKILTWNIQSAKGCDDKFDPERIINVIEAFGEQDVICLQEVARHIPDYNDTDQKMLFEEHFKGYEGVWGACFSTQQPNHKRSEFGNLTLVRSPLLLDSRTHFLPWPAHDKPQIPRVAVETTLLHESGPVSLLNTHLAFHCAAERKDQMRALTDIRDQILARQQLQNDPGQVGAYQYPPAPQCVLLCGDLNIAMETSEYQQLIKANSWIDCWTLQAEPDNSQDRTPTCGCYDHVLWPQGPHIRDYYLVSDALNTNIRRITIDTDTDASDHQPLSMEWL